MSITCNDLIRNLEETLSFLELGLGLGAHASARCMFLGVETQDPEGRRHPRKATSRPLPSGSLSSHPGHPKHPEGRKVVKILGWSLPMPDGAPPPKEVTTNEWRHSGMRVNYPPHSMQWEA